MILFLINLYIIDQPDIKVLEHGTYSVQLRFGPTGEILGFGNVGLWNRLCLGMSYGASNLIGAGRPGFYKYPGVQVRFLLFETEILIPKVILGFDNQGYGEYSDTNDRYHIMSKGIYCQFGEVFDYPGLKIIPSLGLNYSFEQKGRFDMFAGIIFGIGSTHLLFEYSPNFYDPEDQNKGYLNCGIRFIFYEQLFFEFGLRDLLENREGEQFNRMIKIGYEERF
uniref:Outer membrane protein beta-barrel domain-containing protein n=1 Tax=candidate division WOR-3 bacterium TaxID=2052148 RepID=A0A7C4TJE5_UNCW3